MSILTVTSGTKGLGATTVATNLAVVLARLDRRVIILDLAATPGRVAQRLGAEPPPAVRESGCADRMTVLTDGPHGLRIMAPSEGSRRGRFPKTQTAALAESLRLAAAVADFVVVDLPAGQKTFNAVSAIFERVLVVTGPSASLARQANGLIRHLYGLLPSREIGIIVNGVVHPNEAGVAYRAACAAAASWPGRPLEDYGLVAADPHVPRAQMMQQAVVDCRPRSVSSRCFEELGRRIAQVHPLGGGGLSLVPNWAPRHWQPTQETRLCA